MGKMARSKLAILPTPLELMENLSKAYAYPGIYIKRDDMTGLGPGGNKLRSLEFIAGEAISRGHDTLIALGPVQSNLCTLTAAACAKLGLKCILVHNGEKPERPSGNVLLNQLLGAQMHYIGCVSGAERDVYVDKMLADIRGKCRPYVVRNGATTGRGALGYVNAILELERQHSQKGIAPCTIFAPGGYGGVASGLIYGNALREFPFKIVVISVEDDRETLGANIQHVISEIEELLGLSLGCSLDEACKIDDRYRGEGWAMDTPESQQMVLDFPKSEGIFIELIYNSKVLVGMEDYIRRGKVKGNVCWLHTGGFGSLFSQFKNDLT
ncbi:MAG: pyridoxal-phosphate dependent enzyme [Synergistaceae bacterium]|nr:pyridoxal-phosphate dependent enzyme [Synergistaceae bacterium]